MVIARHSLPAFLRVVELAKRFLPAKGRQDVERFVGGGEETGGEDTVEGEERADGVEWDEEVALVGDQVDKRCAWWMRRGCGEGVRQGEGGGVEGVRLVEDERWGELAKRLE